MSEKIFDIQYFADEADEAVTGESNTPDAGESENEAVEKQSFDELIKGDYRKEYSERVEKIVKKRLKETAALENDMKSLKEAIGGLGQSLGIEAEDPEEILSRLKEQMSQSFEPSDRGSEDQGEMMRRAFIKLVKGAESTREFYPGFDIREELKDPEFRRMLRLTGNDPKKSFEILHHDEIIASAVRDAARRTEEKLAGSIASKAKRPSEGANDAAASIYIDNDPRSLTRAQRADIKRRVRRGERITW